MVARFQSSVRPGSHEHRSIASTSSALVKHFRSWSRRQRWSPASDETGCGTSPARPQQWVPDVGIMDTPWDPQLGVAVKNLGWIAGLLASCWTRKSSELSSHHIPHPRRVRIHMHDVHAQHVSALHYSAHNTVHKLHEVCTVSTAPCCVHSRAIFPRGTPTHSSFVPTAWRCLVVPDRTWRFQCLWCSPAFLWRVVGAALRCIPLGLAV